MYASHFGLSAEPFSLTPDPAFFFLSPSHAEATAALEIGLRGRRGLMVMTGEVGTGKTTVLYSMLQRLGPQVRTAYLQNTSVSFDDLLHQALTDLGAPCSSRRRSDLLKALNAILMQGAADGTSVALVIDEAQNLSEDTLENLRLLSNVETFTTKLLQIVLVGQPELETKLKNPRLRQVAERVAVHCHVNPLSWTDSRHYVAHRLEGVGGTLDLFSAGALRFLLWKAHGIPRRINILCHNALLFAYGSGAARVSFRLARAAVREREGRGLVTATRRWPALSVGRSRMLVTAVCACLLAAWVATQWLGYSPMTSHIASANMARAARSDGQRRTFSTTLAVETGFAGSAQVGDGVLEFPTRLSVETWFPAAEASARRGWMSRRVLGAGLAFGLLGAAFVRRTRRTGIVLSSPLVGAQR